MELVETLAQAWEPQLFSDDSECMTSLATKREMARDSVRHCVRSFLAALHSRGLAIVPVEPTWAMIEAGQDYVTRGDIWSAMISARPSLKGEA